MWNFGSRVNVVRIGFSRWQQCVSWHDKQRYETTLVLHRDCFPFWFSCLTHLNCFRREVSSFPPLQPCTSTVLHLEWQCPTFRLLGGRQRSELHFLWNIPHCCTTLLWEDIFKTEIRNIFLFIRDFRGSGKSSLMSLLVTTKMYLILM